MPIKIPSSLVDYVLLGPMHDRRQLQDLPILGDVWIAYAEAPEKAHDLLITPFELEPASCVARSIARRMKILRRKHPGPDLGNIAYLQGLVAARLQFNELMHVVLPLTSWWQDKVKEMQKGPQSGGDEKGAQSVPLPLDFEKIVERVLAPPGEQPHGAIPFPEPLDRCVSLVGLILWAREAKDLELEEKTKEPSKMLAEIDRATIVRLVKALFLSLRDDSELQDKELANQPLVWNVSLNRQAMPALEKSIPAVKADAARTLFKVECKNLAWAILDSGIDCTHPAFAGKDRIKGVYDFRSIRQMVSLDNAEKDIREARVDELVKTRTFANEEARNTFAQKANESLLKLAEDVEEGRPLHWERIEQFVLIPPADYTFNRPFSGHGTHVAGILGGQEVDGKPAGMCPDIQLYDFRILGKTLEETEFAIIAALQYIRHRNERSSFRAIHGVNLSLSILHDVRNFACGRTPVCNECERLVNSGVVVVAAAGNQGWQRFQTLEGPFQSYAAFSITDPGNADSVITVGATHRNWPHTYGISFFSSRGPTGDGRPKPDLVAPGERIVAPLPEGRRGALDGTSMAAPHVSGASAMLMARYSELIGQPRRIKRILCESATDLGRERSFQGHGMLDVLRAFQSI